MIEHDIVFDRRRVKLAGILSLPSNDRRLLRVLLVLGSGLVHRNDNGQG